MPDLDEVVLGIVGGVGPASGVMLHQIILNHTDNAGTDQGHLNICHVSRSNDTTDRTTFLLNQNQVSETPAAGMARTSKMLVEATKSRNAKAVLGVPCNTFHSPLIWNEFVKLAALESTDNVMVLHMLEETIAMIESIQPQCTRVGLMSTTGTRKSRVYHDLLEKKGYEVVEVSEHLQTELHETIYNKTWGIKGTAPAITPKAVSNFHRYASILASKGAHVIIMGCTEIPFAFIGEDRIYNVMLVDPMVALGRAMIREAAPEKLKPLVFKERPKPVLPENTSVDSTATLSRMSQRSRPSSTKSHIRLEEKPRTWRLWNFYSDYVDRMMSPP